MSIQTSVTNTDNVRDGLILVPILVLVLIPGAVFGSPYQSGYKHGVNDAKGIGTLYIEQPKKGSDFHTSEFDRGYMAGFCSVAGKGSGSDSDAWTFTCP
jgi:hypothetical protein